MTAEDIHDLLTRLGIFPKPYPRTIEGAVKLIERQRWAVIQGENEACAALAAEFWSEGEKVADRIRARVKS